MTLGVDDKAIISLAVSKHLNKIPKYQQGDVLSKIHQICAGQASYHGGLNEINRRYGQRTRNCAKEILDAILLEAAVPSETG